MSSELVIKDNVNIIKDSTNMNNNNINSSNNINNKKDDDNDNRNNNINLVTHSVAELFSSDENNIFSTIQRESHNFSDYERSFQEVLMTIENDDILEPFQQEYVNLHNAFLKSHEGENRLLRKCMDLENDINTCVQKSNAAASLNESDKQTIEQLKNEWDRVIHRHGTTKEKTQLLIDKIESLKDEVHELEEKLHAPIELTEREAALQTISRMYESVRKEKENQEFALNNLQRTIAACEKRVSHGHATQESKLEQLAQLQNGLARIENEVHRIHAIRSEAEMKVKQTREQLSKMNVLAHERQTAIDFALKDGAGHELHMSELKAHLSELQTQYTELTKAIQSSNNSLQVCNAENDRLHKNIQEQIKALQTIEHKVQRTHKHVLQRERVNAALMKRQVHMETLHQESLEERNQVRERLRAAEAALHAAHESVAVGQTRLNLLHKEANVLEQKCSSASESLQRNKMWLLEKQTQRQHEEHALHEVQTHGAAQMETLHKIEAEILHKEQLIQQDAHGAAQLLAQVSDMEVELQQVLESMTHYEQEIKKYTMQLDDATNERNTYSKHHLELRHELVEMNKHLSYVLLETNQIKEEIRRVEAAKQTALHEVSSAEEHKTHIMHQLEEYDKRISNSSNSAHAMQNEIRQLNEVLCDAHDEIHRQSRKCNAVTQEKTVLSHKLLNKGKELETLYEQVHTLQHLLLHEELMFHEANERVAALEQELSLSKRQLTRLQSQCSNLASLQIKRNALHRELAQLQQRLRGLLHEASIKVNIHPLHELAWSNPAQHTLQVKCNELQRQIQTRQEILHRKEEEIANLEDAYLHAKDWMAQQPGPEVAAQLAMYKSTLSKKHHQAQRLERTLIFFRQQMNHFKEQEDELKRKLTVMAKEYAARRRAAEEVHNKSEQEPYVKQTTSSSNSKSNVMTKRTHAENSNSTSKDMNTSDSEEAGNESCNKCDVDEEDTPYKGFVAPPLTEDE